MIMIHACTMIIVDAYTMIRVDVSFLTRLMFREIKDGGSARRSFPKKQGGLGGRRPINGGVH